MERPWPDACGGRRKQSAFPSRKGRLGKAFPGRTAVSSDHDGAAFDRGTESASRERRRAVGQGWGASRPTTEAQISGRMQLVRLRNWSLGLEGRCREGAARQDSPLLRARQSQAKPRSTWAATACIAQERRLLCTQSTSEGGA